MEWPLKVELSKLSHIHALQLLCPFLPGGVVVLGLILVNAALVKEFSIAGFGYWASLLVAIWLAYVIGLAALAITQAVTIAVFRKILSPTPGDGSTNTYWRLVATQYVGDALSPANRRWSLAELISAAVHLKSFFPQYAISGDLPDNLEDLRKLIRVGIQSPGIAGGTPDTTEPMTSADNQAATSKERVDKIASDLKTLATEIEWRSLYRALDFMPSAAEYPYTRFGLLMEALQATSVCAAWLLLQYDHLRSLSAAVFVALVFVVASWGIWVNMRVRARTTKYSAGQIAFMLLEIKKRTTLAEGSDN